MADISIQYKGNTIAEINEESVKTLKTSGKYCEDDITVSYTPSGAMNCKMFTYSSEVAGFGQQVVIVSGDPDVAAHYNNNNAIVTLHKITNLDSPGVLSMSNSNKNQIGSVYGSFTSYDGYGESVYTDYISQPLALYDSDHLGPDSICCNSNGDIILYPGYPNTSFGGASYTISFSWIDSTFATIDMADDWTLVIEEPGSSIVTRRKGVLASEGKIQAGIYGDDGLTRTKAGEWDFLSLGLEGQAWEYLGALVEIDSKGNIINVPKRSTFCVKIDDISFPDYDHCKIKSYDYTWTLDQLNIGLVCRNKLLNEGGKFIPGWNDKNILTGSESPMFHEEHYISNYYVFTNATYVNSINEPIISDMIIGQVSSPLGQRNVLLMGDIPMKMNEFSTILEGKLGYGYTVEDACFSGSISTYYSGMNMYEYFSWSGNTCTGWSNGYTAQKAVNFINANYPEYIVVSTNRYSVLNPEATTHTRNKIALAWLSKQYPSSRIILVSEIPYSSQYFTMENPPAYIGSSMEEHNNKILSYAKNEAMPLRNVRIAEVGSAFVEREQAVYQDDSIYCVYPNEEGTRLMADIIYATITGKAVTNNYSLTWDISEEVYSQASDPIVLEKVEGSASTRPDEDGEWPDYREAGFNPGDEVRVVAWLADDKLATVKVNGQSIAHGIEDPYFFFFTLPNGPVHIEVGIENGGGDEPSDSKQYHYYVGNQPSSLDRVEICPCEGTMDGMSEGWAMAGSDVEVYMYGNASNGYWYEVADPTGKESPIQVHDSLTFTMPNYDIVINIYDYNEGEQELTVTLQDNCSYNNFMIDGHDEAMSWTGRHDITGYVPGQRVAVSVNNEVMDPGWTVETDTGLPIQYDQGSPYEIVFTMPEESVWVTIQ